MKLKPQKTGLFQTEADARYFQLDSDNGGHALVINTIEIVGIDGQVNKSAVEDSGNWDTAYSASHTQGTDTALGTMSEDINMNNSYQIVNLQAPASNGDAIRATAKITEVNMEAAHDHVGDNSQAHTDYLINNGDDITSGSVTFQGGRITAGTTAQVGTVEIYDGSDHKITITAPSIASDYTFTLPIDGGINLYVLQTDGSGNTSWVAQSSVTVPAGSDTELQYNNGGAFGGLSSLTWDDTDFLLGSGTTTKLQFRDAGVFINSADDGHLDITADISIDLNSNWTATGVTCANLGTVSAATSITSTILSDGTIDITTGNISDIGILYGASTYMRIGDADTTNHSLDAEDDLMVTGELEVKGVSFFDGELSDGTVSATVTELGTQSYGAGIGNGTNVVTTGIASAYIQFPYDGEIVSVTVISKESGSIVVDAWKCTYAEYDIGATHPVNGDSITAAAPITLSTAYKSTDSTLTGWTKTFTKGDIVWFNVDSATTITYANIMVETRKT